MLVPLACWRSAPCSPACCSSASSSAPSKARPTPTSCSGARPSSRAPGNHILHAMHKVPPLGRLGAVPRHARRAWRSPTSTTSPCRPAAGGDRTAFRPLYLFFLNKWYFDELYDWLFVRPANAIGRFLWKGGDGRVIDGTIDGTAAGVGRVTGRVVRLQIGLRLSLRLRHADRARRDHHLVHGSAAGGD